MLSVSLKTVLQYLQTENVISVGNGTDALIIALESLELTKKEARSSLLFCNLRSYWQVLSPNLDVSIEDCNIDTAQIEKIFKIQGLYYLYIYLEKALI